MGPINFVELKNWVSYKKGRFDFHPNVNVIIGPSGKGKSAMLAALFKLFFNRPMGDAFVPWWGGNTSITMGTDDWDLVYWRKKNKAGYFFSEISGKQIEFTAFGSSVPEDLQRFFHLSDDLNIQQQFKKKTPIFLLSDTAGDAAKKINTFANLSGIDDALKAGQSDIKVTTTEITGLTKRIKEKEKALSEYDQLDVLGELICEAEEYDVVLNDIEHRITSIDDNLFEVLRLQKLISSFDGWVVISDLVQSYQSEAAIAMELQKKIDEIEKHLQDLISIQSELQYLEDILVIKPLVIDWEGVNDELVSLTDQGSELNKCLNSFNKQYKEVEYISDTCTALHRELVTSFPDKCPLCNNIIDRDLL